MRRHMKAESINLFFTTGNSDKVYNASLSPASEGWTVDYEYGRRDSPLRAGSKTPSPLNYEDAKKAFDALVQSKTSKGYTQEESGNAFAGSKSLEDIMNFQPQLLNSIKEDDIHVVFKTWSKLSMQIKHDGERRCVFIANNTVEAANRKGLRTELQPIVYDALVKLQQQGLTNTIVDCEDLGASLVIFDVLSYKGDVMTEATFSQRSIVLSALHQQILDANLKNVIHVDVSVDAQSIEDIRRFVASAKDKHAEGVVLRDSDAVYTAGRPSSGGSALKLKFVERATLRVAGISSTKRSIGLQGLDGPDWVNVGNCSIPSNHSIPLVGELVEIEYLYAYQGGSIYQPVYRGTRTDVEAKDAVTAQLKYKLS